MAIKFRLHEFMGKEKINQRTLAKRVNVRAAAINAYYNDYEKMISIDHLNKFCVYFKCQPGDLIYYVPDELLEKTSKD